MRCDKTRLEKLQRSAEREWRRTHSSQFCSDRDARTKRQRELDKAVAKAERSRPESV
jgi:hypothetical protein